jgi:uncharacterized protein YciI
MKHVSFLLLILLLCTSAISSAQDNAEAPKLKQYYFVLLSKGPDRDQDSLTAVKIQEAHIKNIERLYKEGKIDIAGPFGNDSDWRGIFIFNVKEQREVEDLLNTDEAIRSGRLKYSIHPWYAEKGSILR